MGEQERNGPLAGIRVLDLATPWAEMAGRMLADLGAEVIKVEPDEGSAARRLAPFDLRPGHAGESLYWAAMGLGKRSLCLDFGAETDVRTLRGLAASADVFVESFAPGWLAERGLGHDELSRLNSGLIYVSVTPYGSSGPKAAWPATELSVEASSGRMAAQGDGDRPPLPLGYPQSAFHAGAQAACDVIIALNERALSGLGQWLDLSAQAAMVGTLMDATGYPPLTGANQPGGGDDRASDAVRPGSTRAIECRDGFVVGGVAPQRYGIVVPAVLREMSGAAELATALLREDWSSWEERWAAGSVDEQVMAEVPALLALFFGTRTKAELQNWAAANDARVAPINDAADILNSEQLRHRGYFTAVGGRLHPGAPAKLSRSAFGPRDPAPALNEACSNLASMLSRPRPNVPPREGERLGEAFAGLRVADFSWVAAGPLIAKALADHGATVVKIESETRPDLVRVLPPFLNNVSGLNRSHWAANVNSSKLGITLNLATDEGRRLARRIVLEWADVVMDSYTPGTMRKFGLDYESLKTERPDLISFSTCLMGQTGPLASFGGYGNHGAAIAGITHLTGWPDRPPVGAYGPYSDIVTPRFGIAVLAAAIFERRRSGLGQQIDLSQAECAIRFLEPVLLDAAVNGKVQSSVGHWSAVACPSGVYAASGTERYVALSVETAQQWHDLRDLLNLSRAESPAAGNAAGSTLGRALPTDASNEVEPSRGYSGKRFETVDGRRAISTALDGAIAKWLSGRDPFEAERELCAAGVPAAVVARASDLHSDPQLAHRGYFVPLKHGEMGVVPYDGHATIFSAKRESLRGPAPLLGEHTHQVLQDVLGLSSDDIARAAAAGALR